MTLAELSHDAGYATACIGTSGTWVFACEEYPNAFFYRGSQGALAAVRSGKWKLTLYPSLTLYDLEQDPGEHVPIDNWELKTKLRGMGVQFQREMSK